MTPSPRLPRLVLAAAAALLALAALAAASVAATGGLLREARLLALVETAPTGSLSAAQLRDAEAGVATSLLALGVLVLVAGPLFALALRTAWRTADRLGVTGLRYGPWWCLTAWLVPFANLVIPQRIVKDLWTRVDDDVRGHDPTLVRAWWASFLLGTVLLRIGDLDGPGDARVYAAGAAVTGVSACLAGVLLVVLLVRLAGRADRVGLTLPGRSALHRAAAPVGPSWTAPALGGAALLVVLTGTAVGSTRAAEVPAELRSAVTRAGSGEASRVPAAPLPSALPTRIGAPAPQALPFLLEGRGYRIAMPGATERGTSTETLPDGLGELDVLSETYETDEVLYAVTSSRFPSDVELDAPVLLTEVLDGIADAGAGYGSTPVDGTTQGRPHREALVTVDGGVQVRVRLVLVGNDLLQLTLGPDTVLEGSLFDAWITTLRID